MGKHLDDAADLTRLLSEQTDRYIVPGLGDAGDLAFGDKTQM